MNRVSFPRGIDVDYDETIYIAYNWYDRIVERKKGSTNGQIVAGGNGQSNRSNQLNRPINVIIDQKSDSLIIADLDNRRIVRWFRQNGINGEIIISNIRCWGLAIDSHDYLYVSDFEKT